MTTVVFSALKLREKGPVGMDKAGATHDDVNSISKREMPLRDEILSPYISLTLKFIQVTLIYS